MSTSTLILLISTIFFLVLASSPLPIKRNANEGECSNCTLALHVNDSCCTNCTGNEDDPRCRGCFEAIRNLYAGLYTVFEKIVEPPNTTGRFRKLLKTSIRNYTGRTFLCDVLMNEDIMPDCWRSDLEYFCHQSELYELTRELYQSLIDREERNIQNIDETAWFQRRIEPLAAASDAKAFVRCVVIDNKKPGDC